MEVPIKYAMKCDVHFESFFSRSQLEGPEVIKVIEVTPELEAFIKYQESKAMEYWLDDAGIVGEA